MQSEKENQDLGVDNRCYQYITLKLTIRYKLQAKTIYVNMVQPNI